MMDGQVPWRCLVPADAVSYIIGKGGQNIRQISEMSRAEVAVSKDGETPSTLADKIVTISGYSEAKENACGQVLKKLRQMQGVQDYEPGVFVIIVPQSSAPVIIGSKGAQIKGIMEQSGAEINVGRECIIGMSDMPISINGTADQVVSAVSRLNSVLQDMCDRGKLSNLDFVFKSQEDPDRGVDAAPEPVPAHTPSRAPERTPATRTEAFDHHSAPSVAPSHNTSQGTGGIGGYPGPQDSQQPGPPAHASAPSAPAQTQDSRGPPGLGGGPSSGAAPNGATSFGPSGGGPTGFGGGSSSQTSFGPSSVGGGATSLGPSGGGPTGFGGGSSSQTNFGPNSGGAGATSFGPGGGGPTSFGGNSYGPSQTSFGSNGVAGGTLGGATSFGNSGGGQQSFGPGATPQQTSFGSNGTPSSFGQNGSATSFGPGGSMGGGGMGGMGMGMGGMGGMGNMMGMGGMGMGGMGGMGSMGGMGPMGGMGMMGMGGMGMGMGSGNERAFMTALQASGINSAQLTLLLPQALVHNILVPRGFMAEIAQRSGCNIELGSESPPGMRQVTVSGSMIANSLASLYLQEKALQFQQMS